MKNRFISVISITLIVAELLLFFFSWIISATLTEGIHSLLSAEGIRWFLSHFTDIIQSPLLIWLILISIGYGCLKRSQILSFRHYDYRQKIAIRWTLIVLLLYVITVSILVFAPHAILLSATGQIWPSPFSNALIPIISTGIVFASVNFGVISHSFNSATTITNAMVDGIRDASPIILIYVLGTLLYHSVCYVFI